MKRILIVDDETLIRYGLLRALRGDDVEVKAVKTGEEALAEIGSSFYDLCFLDINLPDADGLDIMKKIKELSPDTKVTIISGCVLNEHMKREIASGAYMFVPKPFDLFQIKGIAEKALGGGNKGFLV